MKKIDYLKFNERLNQNYYDISTFAQDLQVDIETLPYTIRILLENCLRNTPDTLLEEKGQRLVEWEANVGSTTSFYPSRVLLQDYTGVACVVDIASLRTAVKSVGKDPAIIQPVIPVDLVIDHSVAIDEYAQVNAMEINIINEYKRNKERYEFLKWSQESFNHFSVIPPDTGIIHQINIEYLSPLIINDKKMNISYPDTVFGTDSHTTMINGLGVLGWGVGGIEAEACMLGECSIFPMPKVIGLKLVGELQDGIVATDLALTITNILRKENVVGCFVEFFGDGYSKLELTTRATLANMAPEYGSTCAYCPIDNKTIEYLKLTNRSSDIIEQSLIYSEDNSLYYHGDQENQIAYSKVIELDLSTVTRTISGPKRPQDSIDLKSVDTSFKEAMLTKTNNQGFELDATELSRYVTFEINGESHRLATGDILLAAITSCTNTSNPNVLVGAGLLAKNAVEKGLKVSPKVKTSFAPGSKAVQEYMVRSGLQTYLDQLGFHIVAYGCTTCIGNSGPLQADVEDALQQSDIVAAAILSGNRNFEGRIHPLLKANYLASPMLVVAYALAGNLQINLDTDPLGVGDEQNKVYLKDIWPSDADIQDVVDNFVTKEIYESTYTKVYDSTKEWESLKPCKSMTYEWNEASTYIANPPYFDQQVQGVLKSSELKGMRVLALLGDSITTDHISPAGLIPAESVAGQYLISRGVLPKDFNTYGSRRGNHEVMVRGTLANTRLHNLLVPGIEGGFTKDWISDSVETMYDASVHYQQSGVELMIIAGKDYGMGSSRDWAAKGVKLLGVTTVLAQSFERIHRSNLAMMGILPLQFKEGETAESLDLLGDESYTVQWDRNFTPKQEIEIQVERPSGEVFMITAIVCLNSKEELSYFEYGGILNRFFHEKLINQ